MTTTERSLRLLIVAEHASAQFGGEAALPLHYYRVLRARGVPVWLISHARVRDELTRLYPQDVGRTIVWVEDDALHRGLWRAGAKLPDRLAYFTTGLLSRIYTQWQQRKLAQRLVKEHGIDIVHQPMPVSPKEPSLLFALGAPVVIGPMNGGMRYPDAFAAREGPATRLAVAAGRATARLINLLLPGKRKSALLLVANQRTAQALPLAHARVHELVENGVDLKLWRPERSEEPSAPRDTVRFAFLGRLVDWKAVDVLIDAFADWQGVKSASLTIIGDGNEGPALRAQAQARGCLASRLHEPGRVHFAGWLAQTQAAEMLAEHDVLVLPSLLECGGAVVLEAMAMGLPVIATAWGGPADYVDEHTGVLVAPLARDQLVAAWRQAMAALAADPARRAALGAAGRAKVLREYDWERKVDQVLKLFKELT